MQTSPRPSSTVDLELTLDDALRYAIAVGAVLLLLVPAARGVHAGIGWLPLWLLGMPLSAWWALRQCRQPRFPRARPPAIIPAQRCGPQARRRPRDPRRVALPRAA